MDPSPLQNPEANSMRVFYERVAQGRLTTTRCKGCNALAWPPRRFCGECGSDQFDWVDLPGHGRIHLTQRSTTSRDAIPENSGDARLRRERII